MGPRTNRAPALARPLSIVLVGLLVLAGRESVAAAFHPPCTLPFRAIAKKHKIDDDCGAKGSATNPAHRAQNEAKNDFCATGEPVRVLYSTFKKLQSRVDAVSISYGSISKLPEDRAPLHDILTMKDGAKIGEGSLVTYAAFIFEAHYANPSGASP